MTQVCLKHHSSRIKRIICKDIVISRKSVPCNNVYDARLRQAIDPLKKAHGAFRRFIVEPGYRDFGKSIVDHVNARKHDLDAAHEIAFFIPFDGIAVRRKGEERRALLREGKGAGTA